MLLFIKGFQAFVFDKYLKKIKATLYDYMSKKSKFYYAAQMLV